MPLDPLPTVHCPIRTRLESSSGPHIMAKDFHMGDIWVMGA